MLKRVAAVLMVVGLLASTMFAAQPVSATAFCGEEQVFTLWGGQTIPVGTVTVSNDAENIYVTYETTGDWYLTELHLYVLDYEPTSRLTPGHAPYKWEGDPIQSYTFVVPFTGECGTALWLQAHAAVVKIVNEEVVQGETAYGGQITRPKKGSWYGNIGYIVQCCLEEENCYEFADETAWAAGERYVAQGNWATYTAYVPDSTVTLFAGQHLVAGNVHFSAPVDGLVTITIELAGEWEFAAVNENVKIQDYVEAPSGNPNPGGFAYKGTATSGSFSIVVPANNFYGVHADVGRLIEVACPIQ